MRRLSSFQVSDIIEGVDRVKGDREKGEGERRKGEGERRGGRRKEKRGERKEEGEERKGEGDGRKVTPCPPLLFTSQLLYSSRGDLRLITPARSLRLGVYCFLI